MPPRKRARLSRATSPSQTSPTKSPTPPPTTGATTTTSPSKPSADDDPSHILSDPWTDDEEIGLFKGLMQWKPTGIHKHFRLLALHNWLTQQGYISARQAHTRPPGIWAKLESLFDLAALDAREDARQLSRLRNPLVGAGAAKDEEEDEGGDEEEDETKTTRGRGRGRRKREEVEAEDDGENEEDEEDEEDDEDDDDDADAYSVAANRIDVEDFALPIGEGFEELMWRQRLARHNGNDDEDEEMRDVDDASSDLEMPEINLSSDPPLARFTPSFSIEPSIEGATPTRSVRGGRRGRPPGRPSLAASATRRSARQAEEQEEEEAGEDDEDEDGEEEGEEEDDEDEDEEGSQASTPAPRSRRSTRGGARGRPPGSGRGRGRGRPPKR